MKSNRLVSYSFMIRPYIPYRLRDLLPGDRLYEFTVIWQEGKPIEVRGHKTFRLFAHWFKMMRSKKRILYGVVTFEDTGDVWIWKKKAFDKYGRQHGGWQYVGRGY